MRKTIFIIVLAATVMACNKNSKQNAPDVKEAEMQNAAPASSSSSSELYQKEWKLSELNGKPIVLDTTFRKYPHLIFQKDNHISGSLGCNGFGGNIKIEADNAITISDIVATEMACPNLKVEQVFLDVLNNAKSYSLENNVLLLSNSKKQITAKLEAGAK